MYLKLVNNVSKICLQIEEGKKPAKNRVGIIVSQEISDNPTVKFAFSMLHASILHQERIVANKRKYLFILGFHLPEYLQSSNFVKLAKIVNFCRLFQPSMQPSKFTHIR
jgi:hypothetical protein